jgi:hypothetical protein
MIGLYPSPKHIQIQNFLQDRIPMWVVYRPTTTDHPGKWLARLHLSLPQPQATNEVIFGETLEDVRAQLPPGLTNIGRMEEDDLVIEEVWV